MSVPGSPGATPRLVWAARHVISVGPEIVSCPACGRRLTRTVLVEVDAERESEIVLAETAAAFECHDRGEAMFAPHACVPS